MKKFIDLSHQKLHIRMDFSVLHGYWTVELGGINQVFHVWEYGIIKLHDSSILCGHFDDF